MSAMHEIVIQVEDLTKTYRLYQRHADRLKEALHPRRKKYHQQFHALRAVNLEIRRGETLGVIGKNGSGKSTLLKIISGIVTPTLGRTAIHGRLAAILELGAGFNPELSGTENAYFSGTLMGYTRPEMDARLPAIRAFADIGDYMEQPVKTYSSGMFLRLAFAVAVNVDPDVLIVDEALAVGDISFQAKCFRKFQEFKERGKTIVFVSHALDSVLRYCSRAIVLDGGHKVVDGDTKAAVDAYKKLMVTSSAPRRQAPAADQQVPSQFTPDPQALSYGDRRAEIVAGELCDETGQPVRLLQHGQPCLIRMQVRFQATVAQPIFAYTIKDLRGWELTGTNTFFKDIATETYHAGDLVAVEFRQIWNAQSGRYALSLGCTGFEQGQLLAYHRLYDALLFEVVSAEPMVGVYDLQSSITVTKIAAGAEETAPAAGSL